MHALRLSKGTTGWVFAISSALSAIGFWETWATLERDVCHFPLLWPSLVLCAPLLSTTCAVALFKEQPRSDWFAAVAVLIAVPQVLLWLLAVTTLLG